MNNETAGLSILIVTWNGDELLEQCLCSIDRSCGDAPEIVVVDNAALDSTQKVVGRHVNAKYIRSESNLGFAGGNNLGLPYCTRKYVLLLNNDTVIHEEPFSALIAYMREHPSVAVVQGKMNLPRKGDVLDVGGYLLTQYGIRVALYANTPTASTQTPSAPVLAGKGACLLFEKRVLDEIEGPLFHESFINNHEEIDFCHRVWLAGREVHFVDTPAIDHFNGCTFDRARKLKSAVVTSRFDRDMANYYSSMMMLFERRTLWRLLPRSLFFDALVTFLLFCKGRFGDTGRRIAVVLELRRRRTFIRDFRNRVMGSRRIGDSVLFDRVFRKTSLLELIRQVRGR